MSRPAEDITNAIAIAMNIRHGFAFQEAVLRACHGLKIDSSETGEFVLIDREIPVTLGEREFHVDGVLSFESARTKGSEVSLFVAVECKRVYPEFSAWAFGRTGVGAFLPTHVFFDVFMPLKPTYQPTLVPLGSPVYRVRAAHCGLAVAPVVQIGLDIRIDKPEDRAQTLPEVVGQAWRGASGYADHLGHVFKPGSNMWRVQPMVVTTARLFVCKHPLDEADLHTGTISNHEFDEVDWLWYEQNLNHSLSPSAHRVFPVSDLLLKDDILQFHKRSLLIVRPPALREALTTLACQFHSFLG